MTFTAAPSTRLATPLGELACSFAADGALLSLIFTADRDRPVEPPRRGAALVGGSAHEPAARLCAQLDEYFAGQRKEFALPLAPAGTPFQQAVWRELQTIAYGATLSYGTLARRIDAALAARSEAVPAAEPSLRIRAVGRATALNPIAIIIPCHRVIGSRGALTGYAGGLWRKQALLELEGALPQALFDAAP